MRGDLTSLAGRAKRRPPGASDFTQWLYRLLHEHPEGMTRAEIHEAMREGWRDTDAYRDYLAYLENHRKRRAASSLPADGSASRLRRRHIPARYEFGTPEFKSAAQRWFINKRLGEMSTTGSARREGADDDVRWFAARRPQVQGSRSTLVPFDPVESRAVLTSTMGEHVNRENAKAELLAIINGKSAMTKAEMKGHVQTAYDWLCGRR